MVATRLDYPVSKRHSIPPCKCKTVKCYLGRAIIVSVNKPIVDFLTQNRGVNFIDSPQI